MLHLWMPENNGAWYWSVGENWLKADSLDVLIQAIQPYQGSETTIFFPSRYSQIIEQIIPKAQLSKLGADGIRYLLEEFVVLPIDAMSVKHVFKNPDQLFVLGVANLTIENMLQALNLLPIKVTALLPDFLILPVPDLNQIVIANFDGKLLVRENEYMGNSIDDLSVYLDFQKIEQNYKVTNLDEYQHHMLTSSVTQDQLELFDYQFELIKKVKQHPWNMLPKIKADISISGYWKACVVLVFAIIIVQFSYDALRWVKLSRVADQTATQAIQQYKEWFGQNARVTEQNIRGEFKSQLRASQTANVSAFKLLSQIGPVLMQNRIIADQVNYENLTLNMTLKAKDAESLQTLSQQLNQQGLKVELGNIQTNTLGVIGLVKIQ
ncbi:general secretion pathway protein GspL [Acinetobacter sp. ANC 4558]|uniref:type II secretion system protein GspL n=1 Tax=Acinetobacter sp. ANC 4558 TaxID=1977876 RepID=UPI000A3420D1|nr:type II secretion system protein GspL [Acinetobacter sp. ANC 4558]OTG85298.1 general secretion pathway protein GspL [Acinetobacter sp. ANC 4558]